MQPWQTAGTVGAGRSNTAPTYVLEYQISELADGVTRAPQFPIEGQIPSDGPFPDPEQIYTFQVERLGLIDLSLSGILPPELAQRPSGLGQRYVSWVWAQRFVLGSATPVQKANDIEGEGFVSVQPLEILPVASTQFYSRRGYRMPQGTVLRIQDMAPLEPGRPIIFRLGITVPPTIRDDALMREAFCCTENIPTITDSDEPCVAPNALVPGVVPNEFTPGVNELEIRAFPVSPDYTTVTVLGPGGAPVPPTSVEIQFPDRIFFTASFVDLGDYDILLSNGPGCDLLQEDVFTVVSP